MEILRELKLNFTKISDDGQELIVELVVNNTIIENQTIKDGGTVIMSPIDINHQF